MAAPEPVNFPHCGANQVYNIASSRRRPATITSWKTFKSLEICLLNGLIHSSKTRVIDVDLHLNI